MDSSMRMARTTVTNVRHAYLLEEDHRVFDYNFFNINPKEAEAMDPQQRILLETVYEGVESAGLSMHDLRGSSTAVFVGQMSDDYNEMLLRDVDSIPQYTGTGTSRAIMANRVSYFFDWKGPSMNIDTACSSSLVALHQAVQTLRQGESQLNMLSPSGRSRMWDAGADGYARGEGFAVVVLKTKQQAIADNDHIECIIRETGVNQDGRSAGLTVPNSESQSALIRSTYSRSGLDCRKKEDRCQYFEAHGTGTLAGDPKEAAAIYDAFFRHKDHDGKSSQNDILYTGSVKTVIGHSEGTAGLAGLLKVSLAIQHGKIPPNLHFSRLNPAIRPLYHDLRVPVELQPWPEVPQGVPRRASLNSFGFGGTNAHAIIESWESPGDTTRPVAPGELDKTRLNDLPPFGPFPLSANSESALVGAVTSLYETLRTSNSLNINDLSWTLQSRRTEFPFKVSFSAINKDQLLEKLHAFLQALPQDRQRILAARPINVSEKFPARILGVFTGQGAQWPSMGASLYSQCVSFRNTIDELEGSLARLPDPPSWSLAQELTAPAESTKIHVAEISQPVTTALQIALVRLLKASGVSFSAVVGHSSGEIAAVYAAGYLTASDAIRIAYYRGLHLHHAGSRRSKTGKMMAAGLSYAAAEELCHREEFSGPHAALKAPVTEALKLSTAIDIPYHGVLRRGENGLNAFCDTLGFIWKSIYPSRQLLDFGKFREACYGTALSKPRPLKNLPPYSWDHDRILLKESTKSRVWRTREHPPHELLGTPSPVGNNERTLWRNIMRLDEMEWLKGHRFQNQVLFPAAGYVSMVYEAVIRIAGKRSIALVVLEDLNIDHAITLEEDSSGIEVDFIIDVLGSDASQITAEYSCYSGSADSGVASQGAKRRNFTGRAIVKMGTPSHTALPPRSPHPLPLANVNIERFYQSLLDCGLRYSGDFLLHSVKRRMGLSTVTMKHLSLPGNIRIHPATLDTAFQGLFAAFCYPGDGKMWTTYLPRSIKRVRISTTCSESKEHNEAGLKADCYLRDESPRSFLGDVDLFCGEDDHPKIQVEGLTCTSLTAPSAADDLRLFARTVWKRDLSSGLEPEESFKISSEDDELYEICERMAYFYLRRFRQEVSRAEIGSMEWHFRHLTEWVFDHLLPQIESGRHPRVRAEWGSDTLETVMAWKDNFVNQVNVQLIHAVGNALPSMVRGTVPTLQVLMENDMLSRFYRDGLGAPQANNRLGALAMSLTHRYPKMNILEIGAGSGGATATVLERIGASFESYTFTDVSTGFFQDAQVRFSEHGDKLKYRLLDISRSPAEQGFQQGSFDLIIASNVLHATQYLSTTMDNCKWLMRPGGHIMLLEICSESLWPQFIVSGLPGWWLGRDDGRVYHPTIPESEWDCLLRDHGFSGLDHIYRDFEDEMKSTFSVIASQAVDPKVQILRDPLAVGNVGVEVEDLLVVGDQDSRVAHMANQVKRLLRPFAAKITSINGLCDIEPGMLGPRSAVVCLSDLAEPAFKKLDSTKLSAIQTLLTSPKYVLWATRGCHADDPYANMIVGIGRSVMMESPFIRLQFMDIDTLESNPQTAVFICESLLRMVYLDLPEYENILWSCETEVKISKDRLWIPRVRPDVYLNNRVNTRRREICTNLAPTSTPISVVELNGSLTLEELPSTSEDNKNVHRLRIMTHSSSFLPFFTANGELLYLCVGSVLGSNCRAAALSSTNSSLLETLPYQTFDIESTETDNLIIQRIVTVVLCESLLAAAPGLVWIHTASSSIADIASKIAARNGFQIFLSTPTRSCNSKATYIHPHTTERGLRCLVPSGVQWFIDMNDDPTLPLRDLESCLGKSADIRLVQQDIAKERRITLRYDSDQLRDIVRREIASLASVPRMWDMPRPNSIQANTIARYAAKPSYTDVVDWNTESLSVRVSPLSARGLFSDQKTYFLIGLSGGLGLSLCEWMIRHGARSIAIASRRPDIVPEFIRHFQSYGATVRTFVLDITDKRALHDVHREISSSMAPIGGIANGAMVLRDRPFEHLSLEDVEVVLRPKVEGSKNLDELFHSTDLDFFILFSSMGCIIGSPGQSNYAAANMFMSTLAAQRRKRGVVASIIDIAMLLGVGYVAQAIEEGDSSIESQLQKLQYLAISESDFHDIFTAAIESGKPGSGLDPEVVTGLGEHPDAPWARIPRFWHLTSRNMGVGETSHQTPSTGNIQALLAEAPNDQEVLSILETAFSRKLGSILQLPAEKIAKSAPLTSLGIDSLVAVEIRSWFLKQCEVDMPVLKVLSSASLTEICRDAARRLPKRSATNREKDSIEVSQKIINSQPLYFGKAQPSMPSYAKQKASTVSETGPVQEFDSQMGSLTAPPMAAANLAENQFRLKGDYEKVVPMSHAQARLYFLHEYLDDKSACNVVYVGNLRGRLDVSKLQASIWEVGKQHESLRSSYFFDKDLDQPVQAINKEPSIAFEYHDILEENEIQAKVDKLRKHNFEIEQGHVMTVSILSQSSTLHHVIISHHHIVLDGFSWVLLMRDLHRSYSGFKLLPSARKRVGGSKRTVTRTVANWQYELKFWGDVHRNSPEALPLFPFSKEKCRQILKVYDTETIETELDNGLTSLIKNLASELQATPFHVYLSTLAALLSRCLDVNDFCIGIVDANRTEPGDEEAIGYFLNFLPLRFRLEPHEPFHHVARRTRDMVLEALANSRVPFDKILDLLGTTRHSNHHPLFQVALNYRMGVELQMPLGDNNIEWTRSIPASNPYDLLIDITETPTGTLLSFTTQKYLYDASDIRLVMKWYIRALEGLARNPATRVSDCPISNRADLKDMNALIEQVPMEITWKGTLAHRIDEISARYPGSIAVKDGYGRTLTYTQLTERSNQIARQLRMRSIPHGSFVAILLNPIADVVCSLLAVMKLGLVWVPLDLRNPRDRLRAILADCQPQGVICNGETGGLARELETEVRYILNIDDPMPSDPTPIENVSERRQPAVILYTSGSTGTPKGVLLTHQNILNQIFVNTTLFQIGREVVLQQTAFSFDLALDQIFHSLANGGKLIMVSKEGRGDPAHIADLIYSEHITYTLMVPSEYMSLLHYGSRVLKKCGSWRFAFSGGEKISSQLKRSFQRLDIPDLQLINLYGPTEASIGCARGIVPYRTEEDVVSQADNLYAMPNYLVAVLDRRLKLAPVGFPGEICIAGAGLACGYINRPHETKRSFVSGNALSPSDDCKLRGTRFYRTGDMGRILEDGSLITLGRLKGDTQVKVRGIRIELDDIANVVIKAANNAITNAAVSLRESDILVAFVVFNTAFTEDKVDFLRQLKTMLPIPSYMCPSYLVPVEQLPTNNHGKLDRLAINKLPVHDESTRSSSDDLTATEAAMRNVWKEVLAHQATRSLDITAESDFFHVGGNSMLLIKLRGALQGTFGMTLSLPELFRSSTLRAMAARFEKSVESETRVVSVDWHAEVAGLSHGLPQPPATVARKAQFPLAVVLTGATGFLGTHILQRLVSDERVGEIHCVGIRPDSSGSSRHVRVKSDKVFEYSGDILDRFLGLSDSDFQHLSDKADLVIHNGADVSFLKTYQSLRRANVVSTRTLCELAIPRRIPLHFVSTASVAKLAGLPFLPEISVSEYPPSPDTEDGYTASKWASESLLEKVTADCGLPTWIHRPTSITGDCAPQLDVMSVLLQYSRLLRATPNLTKDTVIGSFDLVKVEDVARDLVQVAVASVGAERRTTSTFVHHCSDTKVSPAELKSWMESSEGCQLESLEMKEWLELALERGLSKLIYEFLALSFRYTGSLTAEYIALNLPTNLRWAIAGRSGTKLEELSKKLRNLSPDRLQPDIELVSFDDEQLSTVLNQATLIHACGAVMAPMDLLTWAAVRELATKRLKPSGGTIETALHIAAMDRKIVRDSEKPWALSPMKGAEQPMAPSGLRRDPVLGLLAASSFTAAQNRALINRTWALLQGTDESYGRRFLYSEYQKASSYLGGARLILQSYILRAVMSLAGFGPIRSLLRKLSPEPGTGPRFDEEEQLNVEMEALAMADTLEEVKVRTGARAKFSYPSGPYNLSALLMAQGAMSLLGRRELGGGVAGGCLTPAMLGADLLERLQAAGVKVTVGLVENIK
ncbi:hypothetical protein DL767_001000 [Monosporascus sp. MG133]|nr:hypothetical protein DL767_001000 [Monosporascus sp. MG133]